MRIGLRTTIAVMAAVTLMTPTSAAADAVTETDAASLDTWSGWQQLGGIIYSAPTVSSWAAGRLDVFGTAGDGSIIHRWYDGAWSGWQNLGGNSYSEYCETLGPTCYAAPAAVSWASGRIDLFVRGADENLYHRAYSGSWEPWQNLGGPIRSAPTVSSWAPGRLDIFATAYDGSVIHKWYNADGWSSGWQNLDGTSFAEESYVRSTPAAVSWGPGRIDLFVRGIDSRLYHRAYSGGWEPWQKLDGVTIFSAPAVASWASGRLDVFASGGNPYLYHNSYSGGWTGWQDLGGSSFAKQAFVYEAPAAVSWGSGRIDVFLRGTNSGFFHKWWS